MRLLQIPNYQYPHTGGIEQVSQDIAKVLQDEKGIEQRIICFNEDAQDGPFVCHRHETVTEWIDGIKVTRCGCFAKIASQSLSLRYPAELKKILQEFGPDTVILHYPNPFVTSFLLPMLPDNVRLILWWHLDITRQKILGKFFHGQTLRLLERSDQIIATSPNYIAGSSYLSRFQKKCTVIPNCIREDRLVVTPDASRRAEEIRRRYSGKILCFAVGRHVPYKGIGYLIKASKHLDDRFVFLVGGEGPLTETLRQEAAEDPKIHILGKLGQADMVACYAACDIYCFPSITKNEAFGIALAEGMYFGKPAVTFQIPGSGVNYVSLADKTGLECPNSDAAAYARALEMLAASPELCQKLGEQARSRVEENFLFVSFKKQIKSLLLASPQDDR